MQKHSNATESLLIVQCSPNNRLSHSATQRAQKQRSRAPVTINCGVQQIHLLIHLDITCISSVITFVSEGLQAVFNASLQPTLHGNPSRQVHNQIQAQYCKAKNFVVQQRTKALCKYYLQLKNAVFWCDTGQTGRNLRTLRRNLKSNPVFFFSAKEAGDRRLKGLSKTQNCTNYGPRSQDWYIRKKFFSLVYICHVVGTVHFEKHWSIFNFRFSPCIIIVNHFYCPTNALNYTKLRG